MAIAGIIPVAKWLAKIRQRSDVSCRLCKRAREQRGASTGHLPEETYGHINSAFCDGMATSCDGQVSPPSFNSAYFTAATCSYIYANGGEYCYSCLRCVLFGFHKAVVSLLYSSEDLLHRWNTMRLKLIGCLKLQVIFRLKAPLGQKSH